MFQTHNQLLTDLDRGDITEGINNDAEKFICHLYKIPDDVDTCDKARVIILSKGCPQETLPPTSDAVRLHIRRAHYQASIWDQEIKVNYRYSCSPPSNKYGMEIDRWGLDSKADDDYSNS